MPSSTTELSPPQARWYQSLVFRVVLLCGVLLACLLGSVMILTSHYFYEAGAEMQREAESIANNIVLRIEEEPDLPYGDMASDLMRAHTDFEIQIEDDTGEAGEPIFYLRETPDGRLSHVAKVPLIQDDRRILLTAIYTITPQTEILRAFKNKYMITLLIVFFVTLLLMIYVIVKQLRPLTQLSETCTAIAQGELHTVSTRGAAGEILSLEQTFNSMVASLQDKEMMETKLRQAQRLSALGNLAAGVAHDVRNPLNAIKLLSSHALDNVSEESVAKPLRTIRDEVDRLEEIVSDFLSLAKETEIRPEPQQVDAMLGECARLLEQEAQARGVTLVCDLRAGDTELMLDQKHWTRAVLNVLLNALESCTEGGRVRLFSRMTDQDCEIEIRDDGPGLSRDALERIFEPYYTTKLGGTGLGLSITRGIVEEHGGAIEITSAEGQGCQVLIRLPLEKTRVA